MDRLARTVVAVDWSGALDTAAQKRTIWLAEVAEAQFQRVRPGFTRASVVADLIRLREATPSLLVGLDFGFSFPEHALERLGIDSAPGLWQLVADDDRGERWIAAVDAGDRTSYPLWNIMTTRGRPSQGR